MVEKCPEYHGVKSTKGKDPIVVTDEEKVVCPEIISIDNNFSSNFGREYRARFCCKDFEKCEYRKLTNRIRSFTAHAGIGGGVVEG